MTKCLKVSINVVFTPKNELEKQYRNKADMIETACVNLREILQKSLPFDAGCSLIIASKIVDYREDS